MRHVPFIPQLEVAECGAASLAMVLAYHGHHAPLAEVREGCSVSRDGTNAYDLLDTAKRYGLDTDAVRAEADDLRLLPLPAILHWQGRHFVVLERVTRGGAVIVDPGSGVARLTRRELDEAFSGIALLFAPGADFRRREDESGSVRRRVRILRGIAPQAALAIAATLLLNAFALLLPVANQLLFDRIVPSRLAWSLGGLAAALAIASIARGALLAARGSVLQNVQTATDLRLMAAFTRHLLHLPLPFFLSRRPGDLLSRLHSNAVVRELFTGTAIAALLDTVLVIAYAALLLAYSTPAGLTVIAFASLRLAALALVRKRMRRMMHLELAAMAGEYDALTESLTATETIRATGSESRAVERWTCAAVDRANCGFRRRRLEVALETLTTLLAALGAAALLVVAGREMLAGRITLGTLSTLLMLQALVAAPLESLLDAVTAWQYASTHLLRIDDVLTTAAEPAGGVSFVLRGEVSLEHVSFRYSRNTPDVLQDVSLHIRRGEKIALIGPVGHGKSTLARVILGMLVPESGTVRFDGRDLRELDLPALRRQIGVVSQEPFLFNDTIEQNITLSDPALSHERVREAARLACLEETIDRLREGFDTLAGENGSVLSGGERQRLAIARALAHRPALLLLDEATSALDAETEHRLHANLAHLGCTRIVIAHRLVTVRDADRVIVIEHGRIAAEGPPSAILGGTGGAFSRENAHA
jgi:ATP-binding cassette subfamily B protein